MGPNLYVSPPGSFTSLHQDGFGTVDSGHQCLCGYNEVIMLRRLPEIHKHNASSILTCNASRKRAMNFDGVLGLPHDKVHDKELISILVSLYVSYFIMFFNDIK